MANPPLGRSVTLELMPGMGRLSTSGTARGRARNMYQFGSDTARSEPINFIWGPAQIQEQNVHPAIEPLTVQPALNRIYDIRLASPTYRQVTAATGYAGFTPASVDPPSIFPQAMRHSINDALSFLNAEPNTEGPTLHSSTTVELPTICPLDTLLNVETDEAYFFVKTDDTAPPNEADEPPNETDETSAHVEPNGTLPLAVAAKTSHDTEEGKLLSSCESGKVTKEAQDVLDRLMKEVSRKRTARDQSKRKDAMPKPAWALHKDRSEGEGRFDVYKTWVPCPVQSCDFAFSPDKVAMMNHFVHHHRDDHPYEVDLLSLPDALHRKYRGITVRCIFHKQCEKKLGKEGFGRHFFSHYPHTKPLYHCKKCGTYFKDRDPASHTVTKCEGVLEKRRAAKSLEKAGTSSSEPSESPVMEPAPQNRAGSKRKAVAGPSKPNKRPKH